MPGAPPFSSSFNPFAGHLGHLTTDQQEAFSAFKSNLEKAGLYQSPTEPDSASHHDATLLRFLRARSFNLAAAQKQFTDAEKWRKQHDVERLYAEFNADEFESSKRFYPRWTGRRDKNGLPLYVYRLASLDPIQKELESTPMHRRYQRMIALYELMTCFSLPLCTHLPHKHQSTPISSTTSIIDLEHVSLTSIWTLRHHLQEASRLATANYPETIHTVVVVNSPSFFPTIWSWIKGCFDEGTRNKIHVLGKDPGHVLRELVHEHDLPVPYGGSLAWKYEDEPALDEHAKEVLGEMPKGPVVFVNGAATKPTMSQPSMQDAEERQS